MRSIGFRKPFDATGMRLQLVLQSSSRCLQEPRSALGRRFEQQERSGSRKRAGKVKNCCASMRNSNANARWRTSFEQSETNTSLMLTLRTKPLDDAFHVTLKSVPEDVPTPLAKSSAYGVV